MEYIDYSQMRNWEFCPAYWYEQSVSKRRKRWDKAQRDDALAVGSMVHEGLRNWQLTHTISIPPSIVESIQPTKECLDMCLEIVQGYAFTYPREEWELIFCETPLTFQINPTLGVEGLAKLDQYFYVPTHSTLPTGVDGETITLSKGWWIQEYKTKGSDIPRDLWAKGWETNLQASFQLLALQSLLKEKVEGILVNVLEKPKFHIPQRKCKKCLKQYEFGSWIPKLGGYLCPVCSNFQTLTPLKENPTRTPPAYWRMIVERTPSKLERDLSKIHTCASRMERMRKDGLEGGEIHSFSRCVEPSYHRVCQYFSNHTYLNSTLEDGGMTEVEDYVGLKVEGREEGGGDGY